MMEIGKNLIKIENDVALLEPEVIKSIVTFEKAMKEIKEEEDKLKQRILEEMESKNIIKIDTEELLINYIAPTERETLDSKKLKAEHQDIYDEYIKMTPVKSSIRLKVK